MYGKVRLLADFFISNITYILISSMSGRVGIDGGTGASRREAGSTREGRTFSMAWT
jgi:hypothetical protein